MQMSTFHKWLNEHFSQIYYKAYMYNPAAGTKNPSCAVSDSSKIDKYTNSDWILGVSLFFVYDQYFVFNEYV